MRPPPASLSAPVLALLVLIPAASAILPLMLPALSTSAASAIIGLSTLALVKETLLFAELSSGRYRRYGSSGGSQSNSGNKFARRQYRQRHRRAVDDDADYHSGNAMLGMDTYMVPPGT